MGKLKLVASAFVFASLLLCARFETEVFISHADAVLHSGPWMAALIFAHNSLAATVVAVGMFFLKCFVEALPERFRRRESSILKHPRLFSAAFAVLLILGSVLSYGGLNVLNLHVIPMLLPIAAIESYGLYLAALFGLHRRVSTWSMLKVYTIFAFGALLETWLILSL